MAAGVYVIRNLENGRRYVGSSIDIERRRREHERHLSTGRHHSKFLQRSWNKSGASAFEFKTILHCSPDMCVFYEQRAMDSLRPEYNTVPVAGSQLGYKHTEATKEKMSKARRKDFSPMTGRRHTEETKRRISENRKGKGGTGWTQERKDKISAANCGRIVTPEHRAAISKTLMGHKQSPEQIAKRVEKLRGRTMPAHAVEALRVFMTGRKLPKSHCENIGRVRAKLSDEQVREVRKLRESGVKQKELAARFNIDPASISHIVNRVSYRWVL